jgi:hypothetical protein
MLVEYRKDEENTALQMISPSRLKPSTNTLQEKETRIVYGTVDDIEVAQYLLM